MMQEVGRDQCGILLARVQMDAEGAPSRVTSWLRSGGCATGERAGANVQFAWCGGGRRRGDRGFRGAVCFLALWGVRDAALGGGARRRQLDDGRKAGDLMRNRELLFGKQPQNLAQRSTPPARRCRLPACRWPVRLTCRSQSPAPSSSGAGGLAAGGRCRTNREHWGTCWGPSVGGQGRKPQQLQLELQGAQCKTVSQEIQGHKEVRASLFLPM